MVEGDTGAAQCVEHLTIDGNRTKIPIGVFLAVRDHLLADVKVFREGSADPREHRGHEP